MTYRQSEVARSNNKSNPNQNVCCRAVCRFFGVSDRVRYLHSLADVKRAIRTKYSVRSVKSMVKAKTVGSIRQCLESIGAPAYLVYVDNHVMLLNKEGRTIVDTDPRKRDKRKIKKIYGIRRYSGC